MKKRLNRHLLDDRRGAARIAGLPPGWKEVAHDVDLGGFDLNVDRRGGVFVPTVYTHLLPQLVDRVAEASLALYLALLDLDEEGPAADSARDGEIREQPAGTSGSAHTIADAGSCFRRATPSRTAASATASATAGATRLLKTLGIT